MSSVLAVDKINNLAGTASIDVLKFAAGGNYIRQIITQYDATSYTVTASPWVQGPIWGPSPAFKDGSKIKLHYYVPCRNDSASWGGFYFEPQLNFADGRGWLSLGSSGYSTVMAVANGSGDIGFYTNTILVDPGMSSDFTVAVRIMALTYDGTGYINSQNNVNAISGTGTLMPGINGMQHYSKVILTEIASY